MIRYAKRIVLALALVLVCVWGGVALVAFWSEPLDLWHTYVPNDMKAEVINTATWKEYLDAEAAMFVTLGKEVTENLPPEARTSSNRFYPGADVFPPSLANDWNRSYLLRPTLEQGQRPAGAVVLLHGLTDSPYSLRHIAAQYTANGFVAVGIRLPGHGTVPAGIADATWQDWVAATQLAARSAIKEAEVLAGDAEGGKTLPLHVVGFSNGGALAMKYALDALEDTSLHRPDRVVLVSPMIGVTRFARFAGIASVPAILPPFARAAWLGVLPEFNPFKYNSFPVFAATQSYQLTRELQQQIVRLAGTPTFATLAPVLTFQSVVDHTVSTPAVIHSLYAYLPKNGSELVLFDVNRSSPLTSLLRTNMNNVLARIMPSLPQRYTLVVVGNSAPGASSTKLSVALAGARQMTESPLPYIYPQTLFSLSHGAIPFPMNDPLYGMQPEPETATAYGANLGAWYAKGERGVLVVTLDALFRASSNPFFSFVQERVQAGIEDPRPAPGRPVLLPLPPTPSADVREMIEAFLEEAEEDTTYGE